MIPFQINESFESGVIPAGWREWNTLQGHAETWKCPAPILEGYNCIRFGPDGSGLAAGATLPLPYASDDLLVSFLFRHSKRPASGIIEVLDIYSAGFLDEICDLYLQNDGRLNLYLPGTSNKIVADPIPVETNVRIWVRFRRPATSVAFASVGWSRDSIEPTSGTRFATSNANPSSFDLSAAGILFGPVTSDTVFYYDALRILSPTVIVRKRRKRRP